MIKKIAVIGLILLSLTGCTNQEVDENKSVNPGYDNNTTSDEEEKAE